MRRPGSRRAIASAAAAAHVVLPTPPFPPKKTRRTQGGKGILGNPSSDALSGSTASEDGSLTARLSGRRLLFLRFQSRLSAFLPRGSVSCRSRKTMGSLGYKVRSFAMTTPSDLRLPSQSEQAEFGAG